MRYQLSHLKLWCLLLLCVSLLACSSGCAVLYQLAYGEGHTIEAEFDGLEGQRVAVVCVVNPSTYGDGSTAAQISDNVSQILQQNVPNIDVVNQDEVSDWLDTNDWDESDFEEIGRGVKADMLVAIDIDSFRLHESTTLYKGRAQVTTTVYDIAKGKTAFRTTDHEYTFPTTHPVHVTATDAGAFHRKFIYLLSEHIAKNFYDYNLHEDFARDGAAYAH